MKRRFVTYTLTLCLLLTGAPSFAGTGESCSKTLGKERLLFVNGHHVSADCAKATPIAVNSKNTDRGEEKRDNERGVIELVNKERAAAGLAPLTMNGQLSEMAEIKARDMANHHYFSHTSPTYGSPFTMMKTFGIKYAMAGENIAKGQKSPESVMKAWMNSYGHKANILSASYRQIGVGFAKDTAGNTYWVQEFIK